MKLLLHFEIALLIHYFLAISLIYIGIKKEIMADLSKVFQQFANTANEGEKAVLDTKKVKRALKVNITMSVVNLKILMYSSLYHIEKRNTFYHMILHYSCLF